MPYSSSSTKKAHTRISPALHRVTSPQPLRTAIVTPVPCSLSWRLSEFWTKSITARSRRRRIQPALSAPAAQAITVTIASPPPPITTTSTGSIFAALRAVWRYSLISRTSPTYVALLLLCTTTCALCAGSPCQSHSWWDPVKDKCIPCTDCQGQSIVLRPCQLHRDTICGSIYDLEIDWMVLAKTEPNWKERRKASFEGDLRLHQQQFTHEELHQLKLQQQQQHEDSISLDWQTAALFIAVLACLLFFIVAACILIQHMRQWRRMERRLDQDVEELSTKLMAKLAEVQQLEGGTFFIGNADALKGPATFQPQHVLLPEKPVKYGNERRTLKTLQPGNVYIEDSSSKG